MKSELYFYKSWYAGFRTKDLLPIFCFSKNIQGLSFIRVLNLKWFTYAVSFFIVKRNYTRHELEKHKKLSRINRLLREMLQENEKELKNIEAAVGVYSSSKYGEKYCTLEQ